MLLIITQIRRKIDEYQTGVPTYIAGLELNVETMLCWWIATLPLQRKKQLVEKHVLREQWRPPWESGSFICYHYPTLTPIASKKMRNIHQRFIDDGSRRVIQIQTTQNTMRRLHYPSYRIQWMKLLQNMKNILNIPM